VIELALFDVDGTLFLTSDPLLGESLAAALGVPNRLRELDHAGRTIAWQARGLLDGADPPAGWCAEVERRYVEQLGDTSGWEAADGAAAAFDELAADGVRLALVTGLPEGITRLRMERVGLGRFFAAERGAFGCESEDRVELVRLALERAGVAAERAVMVGDTVHDVAAAHGAGVAAVAFRARIEAEAVIEEMAELPAAARALAAPSG
jgi:phosphoglycolate phosphatase-like HAD superfamily hydrolase